MKLVKPSVKYKKSFLDAVNEPGAQKLFNRFKLEFSAGDFKKYVDTVNGYSKGAKLKAGFVPETTYWLIDNDEYIGRVSIRHKLTPALLHEGGHIGYDIRPSKRKKGYGKMILKLALHKAKKLGIEKVLVTCDEDNIASRKIIESNGGVYENKVKISDDKPMKLRFWIDFE